LPSSDGFGGGNEISGNLIFNYCRYDSSQSPCSCAAWLRL
jgi:hypothetical protein